METIKEILAYVKKQAKELKIKNSIIKSIEIELVNGFEFDVEGDVINLYCIEFPDSLILPVEMPSEEKKEEINLWLKFGAEECC